MTMPKGWKKPADRSVEPLIEEVRKRITEKHGILDTKVRELETSKDVQSDPFRKNVAESISAINSNLKEIALEIEVLHTSGLIINENLRLVHRIIHMLPEVSQSAELRERIDKEIAEVDTKFSSIVKRFPDRYEGMIFKSLREKR
jgi:arginyl-tRNA synthetase